MALTVIKPSGIDTTGNYTVAGMTITSDANVANILSNGVVNFNTTSNVSLGNVSNIHISGGTANYVLSTDGTGNLSWVESGDGGSYPHREETKQRLSRVKKGLPAHNKGVKWSQERKDRQAGMNSGENNPMFGRRVVNNGTENLVIENTDPIPDGYVAGAIQRMGNKKGRPGDSNPNFGKHWITNGVANKMIDRQQPIPDGWCKGRV